VTRHQPPVQAPQSDPAQASARGRGSGSPASRSPGERRLGRLLTAIVVLLAAAFATGGAGPASAHSPDPVFSGSIWTKGSTLGFDWKAGQVPPSQLQTAILAAAADSNRSNGSRAARFSRVAGSTNPVAYGVSVTCGVNGIACFTRNPPTGFTVSFREQGHRFDWGSLAWCQMYATPPSGCFDVENIALDELGHVEILNHHANFADGSDYTDAVVQTVSHAKPATGWNAHQYGRCDVAALQLMYDVPAWSAPYSTCLDLATTLTLGASSTTIAAGTSLTFTAVLKVADDTSYRELRINPLSARTVTLQRRSPGTTAWTTQGTMTGTSTAGTYSMVASPTATYEWRAVFAKPAGEGLRAAVSATTTVHVRSCSTSPCPLSGASR
jgi:hypothetical protein